MTMLLRMKKHLSNIWSSFEKLTNTKAELEKIFAYKKACKRT